eukprot:TRINITY_DN51236_c0_g1_i1.p1 TRINITY_DN51236_c0_g1~~TRINITY_DN51236_c0_g1_i1.p1  ORF type:complete len:290 (-),score=50.47 TRINITY_DN51236_c0_g1_i1:167-955(-)
MGADDGSDANNAFADEVQLTDQDVPPSTEEQRPNRKRVRTERRRDLHVQWDEDNIAEHDKLRGTRQKIDEPPTPFVHSPASISEDEHTNAGEPALKAARFMESNDVNDCEGSPPECPSAPKPSPTRPGVGNNSAAERCTVDGAELAARLRGLAEERCAAVGSVVRDGVQDGETLVATPLARGASVSPSPSTPSARVGRGCTTPSRGSSPQSDRRVTVLGGAQEPRVASAKFKAKRAAHYDEFKMLLAFRQQQNRITETDEEH